MSRFRIILAWLLLLAIPLQGMAAASMLYCGPAARASAQEQLAPQAQQHHHEHSTPTVRDHDLASHHASPDAGSKAVDDALPDAGHKCGVCAACCHSVAITETPRLVAFSEAPRTAWDEPFAPVHSRPTPVPDKPPRA